MREISFRGKSIKTGKWYEGDLSQSRLKSAFHINHYASNRERFFVSVIPETVGQFTGLTDKNGTKIFEGDIVKIYLLGGIEIGQIIYSEMSCRFKFADKYGSTYGFDDTCTFEVIGNIHDNPELLKGGGEE